MLINLQSFLLFHRHSDINGTDKDGIMELWSYELSKMHILHFWKSKTYDLLSLLLFLHLFPELYTHKERPVLRSSLVIRTCCIGAQCKLLTIEHLSL